MLCGLIVSNSLATFFLPPITSTFRVQPLFAQQEYCPLFACQLPKVSTFLLLPSATLGLRQSFPSLQKLQQRRFLSPERLSISQSLSIFVYFSLLHIFVVDLFFFLLIFVPHLLAYGYLCLESCCGSSASLSVYYPFIIFLHTVFHVLFAGSFFFSFFFLFYLFVFIFLLAKDLFVSKGKSKFNDIYPAFLCGRSCQGDTHQDNNVSLKKLVALFLFVCILSSM